MFENLPKNWKKVTSVDYCANVTDGTHDSPKPVENNGLYLLTSKNITSGELNYKDAYCISKEDFDKINNRSFVEQYDVLYSMIGTVGESCIVKNSKIDFAIKNVGLFKFNGNELDAKWFNYYFKTDFAKNYTSQALKGSTQKYIPLNILRKFPVPIPSTVQEQKEIINVLDAASDMVHLRKQCIQYAQDLIPALFQEMFGNPITNEKHLPIKKIKEIANIISGGTPSTNKLEYWDGDIPWLTPKDLSGHSSIYISKGERMISELGYKNSSAKLMPKGSILFTSRAPIGYVAISQNELCTNQGFKSLVPIVDIKAEYLYQILKMVTPKIENLASGTTFKEISGSRMQEIQLPIAPLGQQELFAQKAIEIENYIKEQQEELKKSEDLFLSLLHHAFTGELTRHKFGGENEK